MKWTNAAACLFLALAGCGDAGPTAVAAPREPDSRTSGFYCGMALAEHTGSYGQLLLNGWKEPLWFPSVRDALTYIAQDLVNENEIAGFWVNDMSAAPSEKPAPGTWIEAADASYVIGSRKMTTMGPRDIVPFKDRSKAQSFANEYGGEIVDYAAARDVVKTELAAGGVTNAEVN